MAVTVEVTLTRAGFCRQRAWFADRSSFFRSIRFPAMIAVIRHPRLGTILFDAGYGRLLEQARSLTARLYRRILPFELPERERIPARLAQLNATRVDCIFLSHFHPDHIGGLREVPGAPPILHSRDGLARLQSMRGLKLRRSLFFAELLPDDFPARAQAIEDLPLAPLDAPFGEGRDVAGDGSLIAVALPGHAAGQYGLVCRLASGQRIFLCADAAWLRANIVEKAWPAWPVRMLVEDYADFTGTLDRLHEFSRQHPEVRIIPSHCQESMASYGQQD
jgi:glyoxylase-like metal-dependent hydrolase (beta-lactamase superfamily II)